MILLFESGIVLFIDNNQSKVLEVCKHARARSYNHPDPTASSVRPQTIPGSLTEPRVNASYLIAEAILESRLHLRGETNLGHQYQCLFSSI